MLPCGVVAMPINNALLPVLIKCRFCKAQATSLDAMIWHVKKRHLYPASRSGGVPVDVIFWLSQAASKDYEEGIV